MEIELCRRATWVWPALAVTVLVAFALVGRMATPVEAGRPQVLTPDRWLAWRLERQARREAQALAVDAWDLRALVEAGRPNPVEAMLLARRIYARHRTGTAATGPAREALITAAEAVARYATGTLGRDEAIAAVNRALDRIAALEARDDDERQQHLPLMNVRSG